MTVVIRFMTLGGKFATVKKEVFPNLAKATEAVKAYAEAGGFTHVQVVNDKDDDGVRFTARTPGGRGGYNVAFGDFDIEDEDFNG